MSASGAEAESKVVEMLATCVASEVAKQAADDPTIGLKTLLTAFEESAVSLHSDCTALAYPNRIVLVRDDKPWNGQC